MVRSAVWPNPAVILVLGFLGFLEGMRLRGDKAEIREPGFDEQYLWSKEELKHLDAVEFRR